MANASSSGTKRDVPIMSDSRVSYSPVQQTRESYSVPLKPTKPKRA
jgi:hypothetical protein